MRCITKPNNSEISFNAKSIELGRETHERCIKDGLKAIKLTCNYKKFKRQNMKMYFSTVDQLDL